MNRCTVCSYPITDGFTIHLECKTLSDAGKSVEQCRDHRRRYIEAENEKAREQFKKTTDTQTTLAGVLVVAYVLVGLVLGAAAGKGEDYSWILAILGGGIGAFLGAANYTRRKIEAKTAMAIREYIDSRSSGLT